MQWLDVGAVHGMREIQKVCTEGEGEKDVITQVKNKNIYTNKKQLSSVMFAKSAASDGRSIILHT